MGVYGPYGCVVGHMDVYCIVHSENPLAQWFVSLLPVGRCLGGLPVLLHTHSGIILHHVM